MTQINLDQYGIVFDDSDLYPLINSGVTINFNPDTGTNIIFGGWDLVRSIQRFYLAASDWTQLPDVPLSDGDRALWQAYRQSIRDIPQVYPDYHDVIFPKPPTEA
jgi:hypothetical protein